MPREKTMQIKLNRIGEIPEEYLEKVGAFLEQIIENANSKIERNTEKYRRAQNINVGEYDGLNGRLYFSEYIKLSDYMPKLLQPISNDMQPYINITRHLFSYVLFLWKDLKIFVVTGGQGYNVIDNYIDKRFGYAFLTCLGNREYKVKGSAQKSVTGPILADQRYFRRDVDLSIEDNFGKVYDEINVSTRSSRITELLNITFPENRKSVGCSIKSSLLIKKKVTIKEVISVVNRLMAIELDEDEFISLQYISDSVKNRSILKTLEDTLWENISDTFYGNNNSFSYDIMNRNIDDFVSAVEYDFIKNGESLLEERLEDTEDIQSIYTIISDNIADHTVEAFKEYMNDVNIVSYGQDGEILTVDTFMNHIYCEMQYQNKLYFKLDGNWSIVEDNFKDKLNNDYNICAHKYLMKGLFDSQFITNESEDSYINRIFDELKCI